MTDATPLDRAAAAMTAAPEDDAARLAFYARLAEAELYLLLAKEPQGASIDPEIVAPGGDSYVLAFDLEDRLTGFTGRPAPYAALSGRALAGMLRGRQIGLALNLGAASETLLPAQAMDWLAGILADRPRQVSARPVSLSPPSGAPGRLLDALHAKLATAAGLATTGALATAEYGDGSRRLLLAFLESRPGAEDALAAAAAEALVFSGLEAGALDVAFFTKDDPVARRLLGLGLRFEIPPPPAPEAPQPPGMDPDRPPRLR